MHPAPSIIVFTVGSGFGYGLLFVLALGTLLGFVPAERSLGAVGLMTALVCISAGLGASTLHLGRPERAWRALSQWRSSWLSREGVAALFSYLPALLFAYGWIVLERIDGIFGLAAAVAALAAALTVACTGMIYASLPPIAAWHQPLTVPIYLAFALMTGALGAHALLSLAGAASRWAGALAISAVLLAFGLKILSWRRLDRSVPVSSPESATGLAAFGRVRMLDPPHTQTNYLLNEMGFRLGRKHAARLRRLSLASGLAGSLLLTSLALVSSGGLAAMLALLSLTAGLMGVLLERWLFFAEARHTVMLYYGERPGAI